MDVALARTVLLKNFEQKTDRFVTNKSSATLVMQ